MPIGYEIYRQVARPESALIARFRDLPTADLADVLHKRGAMDPAIAAVYRPVAAAIGPAVTVSVPDGAFETIKIAMEATQPGDVLVINARGNVHHALLGGNVCRGLKARGLAGLVADGAIRDVTEIRDDAFPVFARGVALVMGAIEGAGEVNVPIACGGVVVNPGDIVVADADGVVVVPPHAAVAVLAAAHALHARHLAAQPILLRGEVTGIAGITARAVERGADFHEGPFPRQRAEGR